jgi:hypothetical protein
MVWMFMSTTRKGDQNRTKSDYEILQETFPGVPVLGILTNGEYLGGINQHASIVIAFP